MDGIFLFDKPTGLTSSNAVIQLRHLLKEPRIGHTGTLDPLATGLLVCLCGRATKILPYINNHHKVYQAVMRLGEKTDTGDITGNIIETKPYPNLTQKQIEEIFKTFIGPQLQTPPMYSAKKVQGRKLYEYARKNEEVKRQPCQIIIDSLTLDNFQDNQITFTVSCSAGTYIRVLCEDIGAKLNSCATMSQLRRLACGPYQVKDAITLAQLQQPNYSVSLLPFQTALGGMTEVEVNDLKPVANGQKLQLDSREDKVLIVYQKQIMAVYARHDDGWYYCERGLW